MPNTLFLIRGLPGSGKTTAAKAIKALNPENVTIVAADDYFVDADGNYNFDYNLLSDAHAHSLQVATTAMYNGVPVVCVHNTFTQEKMLVPYMEMAKKHGYVVQTIIMENRVNSRNVHNVGADIIDNMHKKFQIKLK